MLALELAIVILLIAVNGLLALSELAVVSARRARLQMFADRGIRGAATALQLAGDPGRFLSTVQVGITLVGVLAGAFSGTTLGERLAAWLPEIGVPARYAYTAGIGIVVVVITYLSVIIGELVPKQLALRDPERLAIRVAPMMDMAARVAAPIVALLDVSGRLVLRLLRIAPTRQSVVTDEEIRTLIAEAESAGVIEPEERSMIAGVMRLGDRPIGAVMTPRTEIDMINVAAPLEEIHRQVRESAHSRLPAYRDSPEDIIGILQAKDLMDACLAGGPVDPRQHLRAAPVVPDTIDALDVIETLKQSEVHMALVHDEYGHFRGIVTTADILEAIAGAFRTEEGVPTHGVRRADGSWLLDGAMPADEMADLLGLKLPPSAGYHTVGGFMLAALGRIPSTGEQTIVDGWRFEVVDLDGRRIDKVLAQRHVRSHRAVR